MAASDFFSRWAKRPVPSTEPDGKSASAMDVPSTQATVSGGDARASDEPAAPPTLEQASQLSPSDDFRPFVRPDVDPQVRNVAMRQLFSDPHFNVMDGLDIYIDDYNTPNPLPKGDIARMAGAAVLRLIQSEPLVPSELPSGAVSDGAQVVPPDPTQHPPEVARDNTDLRLQPNPDPGHTDPGAGSV